MKKINPSRRGKTTLSGEDETEKATPGRQNLPANRATPSLGRQNLPMTPESSRGKRNLPMTSAARSVALKSYIAAMKKGKK
jgi:hypothetical protein